MANELPCAYCGMAFCAHTHADEYRTSKPLFRKEPTILFNNNNNN